VPKLARAIIHRFGAEEVGRLYFESRHLLLDPTFTGG
jgi:hypothetical protein